MVIGSTGLVSQFMIDEQLTQKLRMDERNKKQYSSIVLKPKKSFAAIKETFHEDSSSALIKE
jgi:hypothetical protein